MEEAAGALVSEKERYEPEPEAARRYDAHYEVYRDLYPTLRKLSHRIAALQS
jgi:sugar (pentulose or hexulose) kinase